MQVVECHGSHYEVGFQHGKAAAAAVVRSIEFYADLFKKSSNLSWEDALENAKQFETTIRDKWPGYYEEMRGIADGASRDVLEIVALNSRTEITFGQLSSPRGDTDGCTSLYCRNDSGLALLGQNWDWMPAQAPNLLIMTISRPHFPTIKMVTEAGLIGKIGINSYGVGVCFNALRIRGISPAHVPAHVALRMALESRSASEAATAIEDAGGLASAAYVLVGDRTGAIGLECTATTVTRQAQTENGTIVHANHLLYPSANPDAQEDEGWVKNSTARVQRMNSLVSQFVNAPSTSRFSKLFEDQKGYPASICRAKEGLSESASLFNIVMDLQQGIATVKEGRPCDNGRQHTLHFDQEVGSSARI